MIMQEIYTLQDIFTSWGVFFNYILTNFIHWNKIYIRKTAPFKQAQDVVCAFPICLATSRKEVHRVDGGFR